MVFVWGPTGELGAPDVTRNTFPAALRQLSFLLGMARAATPTLLASDASFSLSSIDCINLH
jgi:hypothetical protein